MNVLSIDLESWVHKYFLEYDTTTKKRKDNGYIQDAILDTSKILDKYGVKTTFFVVSEVFEWYPELITEIRDKGHEIGFQSHTHRVLTSKKVLLEQLKMGKKFIEEFNPQGFRAPQGYIKKEYLPIIKDWGFSYDSSIYLEFRIFMPVEGLTEVPVSTYPLFTRTTTVQYPRELNLKLLLNEIPFGSGYFIGLLGHNINWFIKTVNKNNIPASLIIHTWQIRDIPDKSGVNKGSENSIFNTIKMLPYEINRSSTFEFLLKSHEFTTMGDLIKKYKYKFEAMD